MLWAWLRCNLMQPLASALLLTATGLWLADHVIVSDQRSLSVYVGLGLVKLLQFSDASRATTATRW